MPRLLARLVLALMLVMGQGLAGQNRASANLARPDAHTGAQAAYNQLSYHENLASAVESRVGYVLFGQAANYEAGNLFAQEEKANPNDPDWAEDGTYSLLLHGLIGAAQAFLVPVSDSPVFVNGQPAPPAPGGTITPYVVDGQSLFVTGSDDEQLDDAIGLTMSPSEAAFYAANGLTQPSAQQIWASPTGSSVLSDQNGMSDYMAFTLEQELGPNSAAAKLVAANQAVSDLETQALGDVLDAAPGLIGTDVPQSVADDGDAASDVTPNTRSTSDPVAFAQSQQGTAPYTGVDEYTPTRLTPGQTIYQLGDKTDGSTPGNFFDYNGESVLTAPSGTAAADDLQVLINQTYGPYQGYTTFQVTGDIPAAIGQVEANPTLGSGGATQAVIDIEQFGVCLTATCYTEFPNLGGGTK